MKRMYAAAMLLVLAGGGAYLAYPGSLAAEDILRAPHPIAPEEQTDEPSDAEIREVLVQDSIDRYTGSCACPYHRKFNEKLFRFPNNFRDRPTVKCGESSEYLRPGGPTVFCYPSDVPAEMVAEYREHLRSTFLSEPTPDF